MADRNYSSSFNQNKAAPAFGYVWDSTLNGGSGSWTPQVQAVGATVNVSGIDTLIVDTDELESIGQSGNAYAAPASKSFTAGFANSLLAKSGQGSLFSVNGFSSYTGVQYLFVYDNFNSNSNLMTVLGLGAQDNFFVDFGDKGVVMNSGVYVTNSLSPTTLEQGAANCFITISYK